MSPLVGPPTEKTDAAFVPIFDGRSLKGWHVSSQTGYGTGGRWVVEGGVIVGSQDQPGNGGILITDQPYGDFVVALETNNDYGPDSGLFLRSTEQGQAYRMIIDYHPGGNLMGIHGEGLSGDIHVCNFELLETPFKIRQRDCLFPLPIKVEDWPKLWKHGRWNELRARIMGNPPTIRTWINGTKVMEFADTEKRHPDRGGIALQVQGGGDFTRRFVRYRNIRVKVLDKSREDALPHDRALLAAVAAVQTAADGSVPDDPVPPSGALPQWGLSDVTPPDSASALRE
ncbi:MAG: DUF1080 domain-containing protein [Armatimonadetes bacterium]|nr:DUF1080 domain-containing protein [Armatimonadota bacterium]